MDDLISRQQAIDALRDYLVGKRCPDDGTLTCRLIENEVINKLPSAQPERKDALEKAVAVEAISDELMSRFDISATYAYDVAEKAMNRIEEMAKELERGEQE